jgi:hypothetical protein
MLLSHVLLLAPGKRDLCLRGPDGYPLVAWVEYGNLDDFPDMETGFEKALEGMWTLYKICSNPACCKGETYLKPSIEDIVTRDHPIALSDLVTFKDTFTILQKIYGDEDGFLPHNWALENPDILGTYFYDMDELPDNILEALGL